MNNSDFSIRLRPGLLFIALFTLFFASALAYGDGKPEAWGQYPLVELKRQPVRPWAPVLKVVMPSRMREGVSPYGPGMERELIDLFLERHDYKVRQIYADSYDEAMKIIERKGADIMIGFGSEPSFQPENIGRGPALAEFNMVLVVLPDEELRGFDLSNVHFNKVAYSASQLAVLKEQKGKAVLLDPATYALLMPIHPSLKTAGQLAEKTGYYWFWNQTNKKINAAMTEFWSDPFIAVVLAEMGERYYGFMPKQPRHRQLQEINKAICDSIGVYSDHIAKAAAANDIDPLLLSAVIFQESRFNPKARSYTGVRGIMQLTLSTADMLGVDRMDPEDAIMGGARYLRKIYNSLSFAEGMTDLDKWCLTLAGFNQGPTVMRRAVRSAMQDGLELDWANIREVYPGLYDKGLASAMFRPAEAVEYVENIRYYYYVLSGLARVGWPEGQNLAGLLASR